MARPRTGTLLRTRDGRWQAQVLLADGTRKRLPPFPKGTSEAMAREKAAHWAEKYAGIAPKPTDHGTNVPSPTVPETAMGRWFKAWIEDRNARGLTASHKDVSNYSLHIRASVGATHVRDWTPADLRKLSHDLDKKVQAGAIAWKTAINVWATATKMCSDAAESKVEALRCRQANPALGVRGPDRGDEVGEQFLYPSEFLKFVSCEAVPLHWRRVVALAVYLYPRDAELRALQCRDLDTAHRSMRITKSTSRHTGETKSTKGRRQRTVTIEDAVIPLIEAMKAEHGDAGPIVGEMPSSLHMARGLRRYLLKAGVDRHELHHRTPTTRPIRFHDLRASGITWMAVRGDDPLKIQHRAGHTDFATTQRYIRTAEAAREGFGSPFPELPPCLLAAESHADIARGVANYSESHKSRSGREDSNRETADNSRENLPITQGETTENLTVDEAKSATPGERAIGNAMRANAGEATPEPAPDPVETALADALTRAALAKQWQVVERLSRELQARREARAGVVDLNQVRESKRR